MNIINQQKGYMALLMVLIIAAVAFVVATSISLLGIEESKMSLTTSVSHEASSLAEACMNEALIRIREYDPPKDPTTPPGEPDEITFDNGTCAIEISAIDEFEERTVTATAEITSILPVNKTIEAVVDVSDPNYIELVSWEEQ